MQINPLSMHSNVFAYLRYKYPQMVDSMADIPVVELNELEWKEDGTLVGYGYYVRQDHIDHTKNQLRGYSSDQLEELRSIYKEVNRDVYIYDIYKKLGVVPFFIIKEGHEATIVHEMAHVVWDQFSEDERSKIKLPEVNTLDQDQYLESPQERFTHMSEMEYFKSQGMSFVDYFRTYNSKEWDLIHDSRANPKDQQLAQLDYNDYQSIWNQTKMSNFSANNWFIKLAQGIDQSWDNAGPKSKWYGFPIKEGIYSTVISVEVEGQQVELEVRLGRSAIKGRRRSPSYRYEIFYNGDPVGVMKKAAPADFGKYNEEEIARSIPELILEQLSKREKSKTYNQIKYQLAVAGRDPGLMDALKQQYDKYDGTEKAAFEINVPITESEYEGEYPVKITTISGDTWYGETALDHPQAPRPKTIFYLGKVPPEVHNMVQFNVWLQQAIQENMPRAQKQYLEYLQSFPFTQADQDKATGQFEEILPIIESKSMDVNFFRQKMMSMGYIRPHRRQKQTGPGMQPQESIKIIMDSRKIVDDAYEMGQLSRTPNFFYTALAYLMHRQKAGSIGFGAAYGQLGQTMREFHDTLLRHGATINFGELNSYIENLSRLLLQELLGTSPRGSAWDNYEQFYGGEGTEDQLTPDSGAVAGLESFIQFTTTHGLNPEVVRANPVKAYRELALRFHPDLNQNNPEAENLFKQLGAIWETIPMDVRKSAENWLYRICVA